MAKDRVAFKSHAAAYVVMNAFFAALWWFTTGGESTYWPFWPHVGWGLGLAFHAWGVYGMGHGWQRREEEKLRAKFGR